MEHEHVWEPMSFGEWVDWMAKQMEPGTTPGEVLALRNKLVLDFAGAPLDRLRCACGAMRSQHRIRAAPQFVQQQLPIVDHSDERLEEGLLKLPEYMREGLRDWVMRAEPHPTGMGHFQRALFENNLVEAACAADAANEHLLRAYALFLYNDVPSACWGSPEKMERWYDHKHLISPSEQQTKAELDKADREQDP